MAKKGRESTKDDQSDIGSLTLLTHKRSEVSENLDRLNAVLLEEGMLPLAIVNPVDCVAAEVNARYMPPQVMQTFIDNIKKDQRLESTPLVWKDPELPEGKYRIISGHHRIEASKGAGITSILVMICTPQDRDDLISRQLAHNAIVGLDDKAILSQLFESISDISKKFATGLSSSIEKINYPALSFKVGTFKELTPLFIPSQIADLEETIARIQVKSQAQVLIEPLENYDTVIKAIQRIKKVENIKSTNAAVSRMVELAKMKLDEMDETS